MLEQVHKLWQWLQTNPEVFWWSVVLSVVMFLGTLVIVPILLVKIPANYFTTPPETRPDGPRIGNTALWLTFRIGKNLLGGLLVIMGIVLLVAPGQGLLTILLGITLLDLPGKQRVEVALLRRPSVSRAVNWLRRKSHRPPLELPKKRHASD